MNQPLGKLWCYLCERRFLWDTDGWVSVEFGNAASCAPPQPTSSHPESPHWAERSPHHLKSPIPPGKLRLVYTERVTWRKTHPLVPESQCIMGGPGSHTTAVVQTFAAVSQLRCPEGDHAGLFFPVLFHVDHSIFPFGIPIFGLLEH